MWRGHLDQIFPGTSGYLETLKATHAPQSANVSKYILAESGFRSAMLLKRERAEKLLFLGERSLATRLSTKRG